MSDLLIIAYIQFMVMLIELNEVLSQELRHLSVEEDYHSPLQMDHTKKLWICASYIFIASEINKYIVYKCMYAKWK
jgi:hypothetical protein